MLNILTPAQGLLFLALYGAVMIAVTLSVSRGRDQTMPEFLLASRSVGVVAGAMSIAASWIWAPALFVSSQKAFEQGLPGAFWFIFPNFLALALFGPIGLRIRQVLPSGFTFPQYIRLRHGESVHRLYLFQFFILQLCSFAVQILGGAKLISLMSGLPFAGVGVALVVIVLSYSIRGGFRASVATDYIHLCTILAICAVMIPWCVVRAGGVQSLATGLAGASGKFGNLFDGNVAYSFGLSATVGLLSGPVGDQMHWQRAYSLKSDKDVIKTFMLASVLFVTVPLSLSVLGFIAAGKVAGGSWIIPTTQMVGPTTVAMLLPGAMVIVFATMLLSGLCSTLDSILCAVSSLVVCNVYGEAAGVSTAHSGASRPPMDETRRLRIARTSMIVAALAGLSIAMIPKLEIVHLFLFYGTLRASTMVPTILTLFWSGLSSRAAFYAVLLSMLFGAPVLALGTYQKNPDLAVSGTTLVLVIGLSCCLLLSKKSVPQTTPRSLV